LSGSEKAIREFKAAKKGNVIDREQKLIGELLPPQRLLMTPGPSCVDPRVYRAMAAPIVGHMDPWFAELMDDVQAMLRRVFQTDNRITFPISASGSGGIEAAVMNPLDAGDECIVCINGAFIFRAYGHYRGAHSRESDPRRGSLRPHR
jgi:hypothetical protein